MKNKYYVNNEIPADEVITFRKRYGMTQAEFAEFMGCSKPTVERMESKGKITGGPAAVLINMLMQHPEYMEEICIGPKQSAMRLWYMHKSRLCTLIDVDENNQSVIVRNFVDNIMFRAFGAAKEVTYQMYEEFLESRCFPKSRDKMKLVLGELDIPFYDPLMIIEKTEGRMAEDDFWIRIER